MSKTRAVEPAERRGSGPERRGGLPYSERPAPRSAGLARLPPRPCIARRPDAVLRAEQDGQPHPAGPVQQSPPRGAAPVDRRGNAYQPHGEAAQGGEPFRGKDVEAGEDVPPAPRGCPAGGTHGRKRDHFAAAFFAIASEISLIPFFDYSMDFVSDSRASDGLWKPSEFSAVHHSHRTWAFWCCSCASRMTLSSSPAPFPRRFCRSARRARTPPCASAPWCSCGSSRSRRSPGAR